MPIFAIIVLVFMPSMAMAQTQCVLTEVDEDGTPTKGRCEERPQGTGDDSDTLWAVAAGVAVVGGVSAYIQEELCSRTMEQRRRVQKKRVER